MNQAKWDRIAEEFAAGTAVPANGWEAWADQATREATMIRDAMPSEVETLVEIGCGVGRLTPYLALLFPHVIAIDTSPACRVVTAQRCEHRPNVLVTGSARTPADAAAALVWCLYDSDWTTGQVNLHRALMREAYPIVLEGDQDRWMLWSATEVVTFER